MLVRYYIPDDILAGLKSGTVHHLEFNSSHSIVIAVGEDESRTAFDARITPEMIEAEREEYRQRVIASGGMVFGPFTVTLNFDKESFRGMVMNAGA